MPDPERRSQGPAAKAAEHNLQPVRDFPGLCIFLRHGVSFHAVNPIPAKQATTAAKVRRRLLCAQYGACLDYALGLGWSSFKCDECPDYVIEKPNNDPYWQDQAERCGAILKRIFVDKIPRGGESQAKRHRIRRRLRMSRKKSSRPKGALNAD